MAWTLGYNLYSDHVIMFNASDYKKDDVLRVMKSNSYQIYLIAKRKKYFFDECNETPDHHISSFYYLDNNHNKTWIEVKHSKDLLLQKSPNPGFISVVHNGIQSEVRDFIVISQILSFFMNSADNPQAALLGNTKWPSDLEVMYIGQSFGNMSSRIAKHDKIKEIALQVLEDASNEEVIVICVAVKANDNAFAVITPETKPEHFSAARLKTLQKQARKRVSAQQQVTLYEAALISYFKPKYNLEYKETFMSRGFKSYEQIYTTDFHYVSAALVMPEEHKTRIWSEHIPAPAYTHHEHFSLETLAQKKSLFDFIIRDQSPQL